MTAGGDSKKGPNLQNFKIVKCKYWEKDGTCRYGTLCTFAHGDTEIRTKTDNLLLNQGQAGYYDMQGMQMNPNMQGMQYDPNMMPMMNPYMMGFDPNMMMSSGMMGVPQGFDPNAMSMNPNISGQQGQGQGQVQGQVPGQVQGQVQGQVLGQVQGQNYSQMPGYGGQVSPGSSTNGNTNI